MDESCALLVEVLLNARGVLLKKSFDQSWPQSSFRVIDQTRHLFSRATEGFLTVVPSCARACMLHMECCVTHPASNTIQQANKIEQKFVKACFFQL
jgi:hypothetical protein